MDNLIYDQLAKTINNIDVKILEHGYYIGGKNWRFYDFFSFFNRIYFMVAGEGRVETKEETVLLKPGKIYIIPPNMRFNIICDSYIEKFYLHFSAEFFAGMDIFDGVGRCASIDVDIQSLQEFLDCAKSNNLSDIVRFKSMLFRYLSTFLEQLSLNFDTKLIINNKYRHVYKFINENLDASLNAKKIADSLNLSYSSLIKNYKKDTGITLNSYIRSALLKKAVEALLFSEANIKEIAFELGFTDEFYFSRFFKNQTGLSPKKYKSENKYRI